MLDRSGGTSTAGLPAVARARSAVGTCSMDSVTVLLPQQPKAEKFVGGRKT